MSDMIHNFEKEADSFISRFKKCFRVPFQFSEIIPF